MILDTSVLIETLRQPPESRVVEMIDRATKDSVRLISVIQVAELCDWAIREGVDPEQTVERALRATLVVPVTRRVAEAAAVLKKERRLEGRAKFGLIDGVILATARAYGERVVSLDSDFKDAQDCVVLQAPS